MARYNKKPGLPTKGRSMGGSMGGTMETTKGYQKRRRAARKAEEARWESLAGPVVVTKIDTDSAPCDTLQPPAIEKESE